ncbi:hypothetical protein ACIBHX_01910 [Nonomuraea sp. NPDC050536]|uniref:hypothetical protein n=1 Tax=Nonomuraea sp. NPDC050536 TaxID=3364366 RepID=UPI0037CB3A62
MRIPFRRKPRTQLTITFTQDVDLEALASGKPGIFASSLKLALVCSCGTRLRLGRFVQKTARSVTNEYSCPECGDRVDVTYAAEVKTPASVA